MTEPTRSLKDKALEELRLFWMVFAFLALMFAAFSTYRRLVLSEAGISYGHYGSGLLEAAVIAKIILVGQALKLGRRFERYPLFVDVLVKAFLYGLLVAVFGVFERLIEGALHREDWHQIVQRLLLDGPREILARTVMVIVAFIPFFALWETGRVLGPGRLSALFFHRRAA